MKQNPKRINAKINEFIDAWTKFAPDTKFSGMTLEEFKTAMFASLDARHRLDDLRLEIKGAIATRNAGDLVSLDLLPRIVAGVVADPNQGANSALYRAMNYVPKIERASGLTFKTLAADAPASSSSPSTH